MSDTMIRRPTMALMVAASFAAPLAANAQDPADRDMRAVQMEALGARIDSLNAEYVRYELARRVDAFDPPDSTIELDTTRIGPLLLVVPAGTDAAHAAEAIEAAWSAYAHMVGRASARFDGVAVTHAMPRELLRALGDQPVHPYNPYEAGRSVRLRVAHSVLGTILTAALPATTKDWLLTGSVSNDARLDDVYRNLVLATDEASHECLASNVSACLDVIACGDRPSNGDHRVLRARASLLAYALIRGGDDAYARLFTDTTRIDAQLANAAGIPLDQLVADWSAEIRRARPNVRADVMQSGLWTLAWLVLLALLATRSTRWRMG